jgi:hypothetical protein
MKRVSKNGEGGAGEGGSDDLRGKIMREIIATYDKRRVPEVQQRRYLPTVLDDVWRSVSQGKDQRWSRIKWTAQRMSIAFAKAQLMQAVDEAIGHYRRVHAGADPAVTNGSAEAARQEVEVAIGQLVAFAFGGCVKKGREESLQREVLEAVAYLFAANASTARSGSPAVQVWAKAIMLAAERERTSVTLWLEATRLNGHGSPRARHELMKALYMVVRKFAPKYTTRWQDRRDIAHTIYCDLMRASMNDEKLLLILDPEGYVRDLVRKRGKSATRPKQVDRNTDHSADVDSVETGSVDVEELVDCADLHEQVKAIIGDPSWRIKEEYRRLLRRLWVERMDEDDAVDATVRELLARPDHESSVQACRKLARKWLVRATRKLRSTHYERFKRKGWFV